MIIGLETQASNFQIVRISIRLQALPVTGQCAKSPCVRRTRWPLPNRAAITSIFAIRRGTNTTSKISWFPRCEVSGYRPADYRVESSSGFMLVTFTSDESVTEAGFQASWMINQAPPPGSSPPASTPSPTPEAYNCSTGPCNCAYHTALHGVFSDGSGNGTMYRSLG